MKGGVIEIGPMDRQEDEFGIGGLPEQKIRQPLLARGADHEIGIGDAGGVELRAKRSGVLGVLVSVHAFSSSTLGPILIGFFFVIVVLGAGLLAWRGDRLRAPVGVDHPLSREGLFVANNILFVGFAIVVLLGTVFPLLYPAINGTQVTVGTPYFASVAAPVAVVLLLLMAIAPLVSWRSADAKVLWERTRVSAWAGVVAVPSVSMPIAANDAPITARRSQLRLVLAVLGDPLFSIVVISFLRTGSPLADARSAGGSGPGSLRRHAGDRAATATASPL